MDESPRRKTGHPPEPAKVARQRHAKFPVAPNATVSVFVYAWLLATVSVVIFLAAGPVQGSLGIFLVGAGVVLTFFPARVRVEWPLWLAVAGLLACGSLAFLPAQWFAVPHWRAVLGAAPAIHLPSTVTPVPWETGFWLAVLGLSCLLGLYLLGHPIHSKAVLGLAVAAVSACGAYAALSIYAKQSGWHYPFSGGANFGFFPNRNHTATFLVTGSVLALGVLTVGLREGRWTITAFVATGTAICVAGLFFFSGSRGGVVFLVVGILIWVAGLGRAHWTVPLIVSVGVLAVAAGGLFLMSGGDARARLLGAREEEPTTRSVDAADGGRRAGSDLLPGNSHDVPLDLRLLIYRDTLDLIGEMPLSGGGLGAFAPVFAEYRRASFSGVMLIHPESDWLMLTAEAGIPATIFALLAGGLLMLRLRGAGRHPYWPLRWGCVAAVAAAVLHGVADVPMHRVALGWWILLLAGVGFQRRREHDGKSPFYQRAIFILGGVGALALGTQLIRAEWFGAAPLPPFAAARAQAETWAIFRGGNTDEALERARAAVATSPFAAPLYYQLGFLLLHFEDTDAEADQVFQAERLLDRTWPKVPLLEGDCWSRIDPKRTASLWLDALDRQQRIDAHTDGPPGAARAYEDLLRRAQALPDVQRGLSAPANIGPAFTLAWVAAGRPDIVRESMGRIVSDAVLLPRFSAPERKTMLLRWDGTGDHASVDRFLDEHPDWSEAGWAVRLRRLIDAREFEQAVRETAARDHVSLALPAPAGAVSSRSPTPGEDVVARFNDEWSSGNTNEARRLLLEAEKSPDPSLTPEYWRLRTAVAAQDGTWPAAWQALNRYLLLTHASDAIPQ